MSKKKNQLPFVRIGATSATLTLFTNFTAQPQFTPTAEVTTSTYQDSMSFQFASWIPVDPNVDPEGFSWKSQLTVSAVSGAAWPIGLDDTVIVQVLGGTSQLSTFSVIMEAKQPDFQLTPSTIELSYAV